MKAYPLPKGSDLILKFQKVKLVIFGENAVSLINWANNLFTNCSIN